MVVNRRDSGKPPNSARPAVIDIPYQAIRTGLLINPDEWQIPDLWILVLSERNPPRPVAGGP
nr:hypothetical protein SHINE37_10193 [Rhizobiaceae bacterium]